MLRAWWTWQGLTGQNLKITKDEIQWNNDLYLYRDAANIFAQRNLTNAQAFRVYNTWDTAGANYERAALSWNTNVLDISTTAAGTGKIGRAHV